MRSRRFVALTLLGLLLVPAATLATRRILRQATGGELSTCAMLDHYQPLLGWLEAQNAGRRIGWEYAGRPEAAPLARSAV